MWKSRPIIRRACLRGLSAALTLPLFETVGWADPQVGLLLRETERTALRAKIAGSAWSRQAYADVQHRLESHVQRHVRDPDWILDRLQMNWETHYTTDVLKAEKWESGEGRVSLCTAFLGDRLKSQGRDTALVQAQLKRFADRITDGGNKEGTGTCTRPAGSPPDSPDDRRHALAPGPVQGAGAACAPPLK